jgi:hypothetical protein
MCKALGVVIKAAPKKAKAVKKKAADSSGEEEDEATQSPAKKQKLEVDGGDVQDGEDES